MPDPKRAPLSARPRASRTARIPALSLALSLSLALAASLALPAPAPAQVAIPMPGQQAQQTQPGQPVAGQPAPSGGVAIPLPAQTPAQVGAIHPGQPQTPLADMDWRTGTLTATAEAAPLAEALDPDQSPALAGREALIQARRQLMERLKTLALDPARPVSEFFSRNREAEFKASAILQNSQVLQSGPKPGGGAMAKVRASLWGPLAEALIPRGMNFQGGAYVVRSEDQNRTQTHSGLVVDARGTGAAPAILPRVVDERGAEAYGAGFATRACAASQGLAAALTSPEEALKSGRVGTNPLVVKALRAQGRLRAEVVLDTASANAVRGLAGKGGPLSECRAAILYDGLESAQDAAPEPSPGVVSGAVPGTAPGAGPAGAPGTAPARPVPSPFGAGPPASFSPASPGQANPVQVNPGQTAPGGTVQPQPYPVLPPQRPVPANGQANP
jgi:hypothetical protein